jgi:hypothetical protein
MTGPSLRLIVAASAASALLAPAMAGAQAASSTNDSQIVATAPAGPTAPRPASAGPIASVSDPAPPSDVAPQDQSAPADRKIHGEISVGAGTGGYREVDGEASAPIGDTGQADIAIDAGQISGRR